MTIHYVDDLIILASNVIQLKWLKSELEKKFERSDLEELHYYLGVEFKRNIEEVLKHFNMEKRKLVGTLFNVN